MLSARESQLFPWQATTKQLDTSSSSSSSYNKLLMTHIVRGIKVRPTERRRNRGLSALLSELVARHIFVRTDSSNFCGDPLLPSYHLFRRRRAQMQDTNKYLTEQLANLADAVHQRRWAPFSVRCRIYRTTQECV